MSHCKYETSYLIETRNFANQIKKEVISHINIIMTSFRNKVFLGSFAIIINNSCSLCTFENFNNAI